MDFYALATEEFLSSLGKDDDSSKAYDNLSAHVHDGEELDDEIGFWQPFEYDEPEFVLECIDNLASRFEDIYNQGARDGAQELLNQVNKR